MKPLLPLLLISLLSAALARAGDIVGTIHAESRLPEAGGGAGGKYASRRYKFVETINYEQLHDFVVYVDFKPEHPFPAPAKAIQVITQKDAVFHPHILPLLRGTRVEWPNHDEIFHNVFSMSDGNQFDLGLYKDPEVKVVEFDHTGRVDVFCSIHSKMNCVILVLDNPWFASADASGHFIIRDVPAGKYKVKGWHERLPADVKEVTVPEKGEVKVDFVLGVKNLPAY